MTAPKKVFVNNNGQTSIVCPHCGLAKHVSVAKFRGRKSAIKVRCKCGQGFSVTLDFRQKYRKATDLPGFYEILDEEENPISFGTEDPEPNCRITNLSMTGLRLELNAIDEKLHSGSILHINFTLDDKTSTPIERDLEIVNMESNTIGCRFTDPAAYEKIIGFYLMP